MKINKVYDIRLSNEEYKLLNEVITLRNYLLSYGEEMILMLTEENLEDFINKLESHLYCTACIKVTDEFKVLSSMHYELKRVYLDSVYGI